MRGSGELQGIVGGFHELWEMTRGYRRSVEDYEGLTLLLGGHVGL